MDYRSDDRLDMGYCPLCKRELRGLTSEAKGLCEVHGWVFADFSRPRDMDEEMVEANDDQ